MADVRTSDEGRLLNETVAQRRVRLGADGRTPRPKARNTVAVGLTVIAALLVLVVVAGLPGPESIRRYPATSLISLTDRINAANTGSPCSSGAVTPASPATSTSDVAAVNWWTGRIEVRGGMTLVDLTVDEQAMIEEGRWKNFSCGGDI